MKPKIKKLLNSVPVFPKENTSPINSEEVKNARTYINNYWPRLTRKSPNDDGSLISLPNPYLVPAYEESHSFDFDEMYYWDSYFMVQGMLDDDHKDLVMGILDNLIFLYERFQVIPNASRTYLTGRSQPPLLTSFIWDVYETYNPGKVWLHKYISIAIDEYHRVWMGTKKPNERLVYKGLSRYYDINHVNDLAEAESGWDMTPRFNRRALNYLPIDLNCLLYKYESDFVRTAKLLGDKESEKVWTKAMNERSKTINELMWDEGKGLFFDYNFTKNKKSSVASLASYFPLWSGMASEAQAKKLVKNLSRFEYRGGLSTTDGPTLNKFMPYSIPEQWSYPNGWAPLHFIVIGGLIRYGYTAEAQTIAQKWLRTNLDWFNKHHVFLEKYNVVKPQEKPASGLYPSQTGFGWTNAIFEAFCKKFID
jgi:alpha,alpha-trehalase